MIPAASGPGNIFKLPVIEQGASTDAGRKVVALKRGFFCAWGDPSRITGIVLSLHTTTACVLYACVQSQLLTSLLKC